LFFIINYYYYYTLPTYYLLFPYNLCHVTYYYSYNVTMVTYSDWIIHSGRIGIKEKA